MSHVVATIYCNVYRLEFSVKNCCFFAQYLLLCCKWPADKANGHVRPSSSLWFVQHGLDRVSWLALILGHCRCVG